MTAKNILTILAIIGAVVVLGVVLQIAFSMIGVLILFAVGFTVYSLATGKIGKGR